MEIKIPSNLNSKETKCFNEIVKPQLEKLYSYDYGNFKVGNINIFIAKDKFPDNKKRPGTEEIKYILNKIPKKDLAIISDIYFVSYNCKDDNHKDVKGRTLPIVYKIIIYPKAYNRLKIILTHEIGHIVFEKRLSNELKLLFATVMIKTFMQIAFWSQEEKNKFIKEEFANCYDNFINNPERLKKFSFIYDFFEKYYN